MFLEVVTLVLLAIVLLSKWWTARHMQKLSLELTELENTHTKLKGDHETLFAKRQQTEQELKGLQAQKTEVEEQLGEIKEDLEEQLDRNEELEGG